MAVNFSKKFFAPLLAYLISIFICGFAWAGSTDETYENMVKNLKSHKKVDITAMRMAYTKTAKYNPTDSGELKSLMEAHKNLKDKKYKAAVEIANKILEKNYLLADAHMILGLAYKRLGKVKESNFHRSVAEGVFLSIMKSGNGKTPKTAWVVISVTEEHFLLKILNMRSLGQSLEKIDGHSYDRVNVVHPRTGKAESVYFNIDIPGKWLSAKINSKK